MKLLGVCNRPMTALDCPVLASYWSRSWRTGCVLLPPPRPSCLNCVAAAAGPTANRRPAFVQVAAGIATSLPPTCLLFCKYNVRPWQINKLTSAPERAAGFRCRGKNHQPSSYLKRFKRVEKSGSGSRAYPALTVMVVVWDR